VYGEALTLESLGRTATATVGASSATKPRGAGNQAGWRRRLACQDVAATAAAGGGSLRRLMEVPPRAGNHQAFLSASTCHSCASTSVGCCGREDKEAADRFESTAPFSRVGGSTSCLRTGCCARACTERRQGDSQSAATCTAQATTNG
jgi:hypothetical protein